MERYIRFLLVAMIAQFICINHSYAGEFVFPFASTSAYSNYWALEDSYPGHKGVDYACPQGTPVYSSVTGTVVSVKEDEYTKSCSGFGNNILISYGSYTIRYAHLLANSIPLNTGDPVNAGQKVGETSNTGYTTNTDLQCLPGVGYHLHYEVQYNGTPVNPYAYNGGLFKIDSDGTYHFPSEVVDCANYSDYIDDTETEFDSLIGNPNGSPHQYYQLGEYSENVCIQDYQSGGSTNSTAAIIYDYEEDARQAYLVRSGFWNHYANTCGGPEGNCSDSVDVNDCGAPIDNEYSQGGNTARQDFQTCYLYWNGSASSSHFYPEVAPGWFDTAGWNGEVSYAFAEAYANNGARNDMGEASDVVDGAGVHHWGNNSSLPYVQDFEGGNYGWAILMYNEDSGNAYAIHSGFWDTYQDLGPGTYGPPCNDEYVGSDGKTYQDFEYYTFRYHANSVTTQARSTGCGDRTLSSWDDEGSGYTAHEDQYLFIDTDQNGVMDPCIRRADLILCDENRDGNSDYAFSYGDGISATYFPTRFGVAVVFNYGTFYADDDADGYTDRTFTFGGSTDQGHYLGNGGALAIQRYTRYFLIDNNADGVEEWFYPFGWGLSSQHYYLTDLNGDNVTDLVFRQGNLFTVDTSQDGSDDFYFTYGWGDTDDYYFADLDSDGKDEIMVRRGSTFYVLNNTSIPRTCSTCSNSANWSFSYGNGL